MKGWALIIMALLVGCGDSASSPAHDGGLDMSPMADLGPMPDGSVDTDGSPPDAGPQDHAAEQARLFAAREIIDVSIEISPISWQRLVDDPRSDWVPASITVDGKSFSRVGLKLKGGRGSFRKITQKAAFKIDLDRYDASAHLHGLRKLTFNNMIQDVTKTRERLASLMFQRFGLPAARIGYAEITVNGTNYGLYSHPETFDDDYLARTYPGPNGEIGPLYEGSNDADLTLRQISWFDLDAGDDPDEAALRDLIRALDVATPKTLDVLGQSLDWPMVQRFFAAEILTGHWDGYAQLRNNYFVHQRADTGRWIFMPWGTDQAFQRTRDAFSGPGRVFRMCVSWTECRVAYAAVVTELAEIMRAEDWAAEVDRLAALTEEAFGRDRKTPTRPEQRTEGLVAMKEYIASNPDRILGSIRCLEGDDSDDDGVLSCAGDCDDNDPARFPGADDTCSDEIDQDCSGFTDDGQFCPPCRDAIAPNGAHFLLCHRVERFGLARDTCAEQGGHVASIRSQEEQDFISAAAFERKVGRWWIGMYDYYEEGRYEWHDGAPVEYTAFSEGEPNNNGGYEDCVCLGNGNRPTWNDLYCGVYMPVICRVE